MVLTMNKLHHFSPNETIATEPSAPGFREERLLNGVGALAALTEILDEIPATSGCLNNVHPGHLSSLLSCILREINRPDAHTPRDRGF